MRNKLNDMKENINEHDMTKKMMEVMRGGFKTKLITENQGDDTISPQPGDAVFNDELKKLRDTVDKRVKITNFKIYPTDENVIIEGTFLYKENDNTGIKFKMSLEAGELETSMNNIDLSDKVNELLQRLKGYYDNWVEDWSVKITDEYHPKQD